MRGDIMQFQDVVTAIMHAKPDRIMNLAMAALLAIAMYLEDAATARKQ